MIGALLAAGLLLAAPAAAPAAVSCGQTITQNTTLEADLNCSETPGIVIGAPGITLDLGGHSVYSGSVSILNHGYDDVTIENGSVEVNTVGIRLQGVHGNVVRHIDLSGLQNGIELTDSDANRIVANRLASVWIRLQGGSDDNVVRGNTVVGSESFISVAGSNGNRVVGNIMSAAEGAAVWLYQSNHTLVANNDIRAALGGGVSLIQSHDNRVSDNVVHARASGSNSVDVYGVEVTDSHANLLARNHFFDTTTAIHVVSGWANELRRNEALGGLADGFLVDATTVATKLLSNYVQNFGDDGIDVRASSSRLGSNTANANGALGIRAVAGVTDLGGNQASGNGDPAQCVNVVCN